MITTLQLRNINSFGLLQQGHGLFHAQQEPENRYQYNGIEHEEEIGLDLAFFRSYDPAIGRWMQVDPAASSFPSMSPYTGMGNNPLVITDALGDSIRTIFFDKDGNQVYAIPDEVQPMFNSEYGIEVGYC